MTLRKAILTIHLCLGLLAGIFLVILGLTGSVMAFEGDIQHWLHPGLWYVTPGKHLLSESDLVSIAANQFPGTRVLAVQFPRAENLVHVMQMTDGTAVYINPYEGTVQGTTVGTSSSDRMLGYIHQLHLRLVPVPRSAPRLAAIGKVVVTYAGCLLCLLVPTGLVLWWRDKRTSFTWKASWFKRFFDAHHAIGIYASSFLLLAAVTGILIGLDFGEKIFYSMTKSSPPARSQSAPSAFVAGVDPITPDRVLDIARGAIPNAVPSMLVLPQRPAGSYTVMMRVPEETSESVHSSVTVDQYSGKVLIVRNYSTDSKGYRWIRFNRSIHTGDVFGFPSHVLVSASSLLLVAMVITGVVIWWKKLAL